MTLFANFIDVIGRCSTSKKLRATNRATVHWDNKVYHIEMLSVRTQIVYSFWHIVEREMPYYYFLYDSVIDYSGLRNKSKYEPLPYFIYNEKTPFKKQVIVTVAHYDLIPAVENSSTTNKIFYFGVLDRSSFKNIL